MGWSESGNQLTTSDSVGIGLNLPATKLHVEGTSDQGATVAVRRSDNNKFARLGVGVSGVTLEIDPRLRWNRNQCTSEQAPCEWRHQSRWRHPAGGGGLR